jgi:hypothetical protein
VNDAAAKLASVFRIVLYLWVARLGSCQFSEILNGAPL